MKTTITPANDKPVTLLLYEDNKELRENLVGLISLYPEFELLASFENCLDIEGHVKGYEPDVLLMDIEMPLVDGIKGVQIVRQFNEMLPIIMLTVFEDNKHVLEAIIAGATGYILKQYMVTHLASAIQEALRGGAPMSPVIARMVLKHINESSRKENDYALTPREKDILFSLTNGNSYKMIAADLNITTGTVCTHIKHIYEKLQVHSQSEAVSKTLRERLL